MDEEYLIEEDLTGFMVARDGDDLMTPFQCGECHYFNIHRRAMNPACPADELLSICNRRASIDSFWARERLTVASNLWLAKQHLADQESLGSELDVMPRRGPYPILFVES